MTAGTLILQLRIRSTTTKGVLDLVLWKDSYLGPDTRCEGVSGQYSTPRDWLMTFRVEPPDWTALHVRCFSSMSLAPFVLRLRSKSLLLVAGRAYHSEVSLVVIEVPMLHRSSQSLIQG